MSLLAFQGTFTAKTSTGTQAITGVGFRPKGIIFYATTQTADGFGSDSVAYMMIGFAGSDNSNGVVGWVADDNVSAANVGVIDQTTNCIAFASAGTPTEVGQATISSMDADGFTLSWSQAAGSAWKINYLALGGSSITKTRTGPLLYSTTPALQSTGNPGFRPSFVMAVNGDSPGPSFGMASGPSHQACMYWFEEDGGNPSNIKQTWSAGNLIGGYRTITTPNNIQPDFLAALSAFTPTGFTVNFSDLPANSRGAIYFAIQGGTHLVGTSNAPAATGTQTLSHTTEVHAAAFFSNLKAAASDDSFLSFGATDGSNYRAAAYLSQDNAHNTVTNEYNDAHLLLAGATIATPSADSVADLTSFSAKDVNLNWTAVSGAQEEFAYWLMGPGGSVGQIIRYL